MLGLYKMRMYRICIKFHRAWALIDWGWSDGVAQCTLNFFNPRLEKYINGRGGIRFAPNQTNFIFILNWHFQSSVSLTLFFQIIYIFEHNSIATKLRIWEIISDRNSNWKKNIINIVPFSRMNQKNKCIFISFLLLSKVINIDSF